MPAVNMSNNKTTFTILCSLMLAVLSLRAADEPADKFHYLEGPATAQLGNAARIEVPAGFIFIDGKTLRKLMQSYGEPVSGNELGSLESTNGDLSITFNFDDIGYVKDDEKDKLDADLYLKQIREGTEEANKVREKSGNPPIRVVGWELAPRYNEVSHNLEWAVRGECQGVQILNYDVRLLGRKGVMRVKLIVDPDKFAATMPVFTNLMAGYSFNTGESYAEYRQGDKIAKYGLGALILGGAAVGAAKLGLLGPVILFFKKAWKLVIVVVVAAAAFVKRTFRAFFGRPDRE